MPADLLASVRGDAAPVDHNARSIAALAANPGCDRRAVLDAAGVDKDRTAARLGFPARFGQSTFAITRARAFEAQVKADDAAELARLVGERLGLGPVTARYADLRGGEAATRAAVTGDAVTGEAAGPVFHDHPLLGVEIAGQRVTLDPDVILFAAGGRFHVVAIKSFPVIDGQADGRKVAAAAREAAVYTHALSELAGAGRVSHEVVLVCPANFANRPTATLVDVRKQLGVLRRQLSRLTRAADLVPDGVSFDPGNEHLERDIARIGARYAPECMAACELAFFCRHEAHGSTDRLGRAVRDEVGGIAGIEAVLALADGGDPAGHQEIAELLRFAKAVREETLIAAGGDR
ncbi:MAG: hypothetical protein HOV86_03010 [Thermoactinospora sp.]|nr:hypothetical protein [Thermoactinospora sp.]